MKAKTTEAALMCEVLLMPDGQIYVHNLTPEMAAVLNELNPDDPTIKNRVITHVDAKTKKLLPPGWQESDSNR